MKAQLIKTENPIKNKERGWTVKLFCYCGHEVWSLSYLPRPGDLNVAIKREH